MFATETEEVEVDGVIKHRFGANSVLTYTTLAGDGGVVGVEYYATGLQGKYTEDIDVRKVTWSFARITYGAPAKDGEAINNSKISIITTNFNSNREADFTSDPSQVSVTFEFATGTQISVTGARIEFKSEDSDEDGRSDLGKITIVNNSNVLISMKGNLAGKEVVYTYGFKVNTGNATEVTLQGDSVSYDKCNYVTIISTILGGQNKRNVVTGSETLSASIEIGDVKIITNNVNITVGKGMVTLSETGFVINAVADFSDSAKNTAIFQETINGQTVTRCIIGVSVWDAENNVFYDSVRFGANSSIQYQLNDKDTIIIGLNGSIEGQIITGSGWQTKIFEKDSSTNKYKYVSDKDISFMHKVSEEVSVMTTNITIDSILSNGTIKDTITVDWSNVESNTAIIDLDGEAGDRCAYITKASYDAATNTVGYTAVSQVQYQVNDKDTIMFGLKGTGTISFDNGLKISNLGTNIKADSISYMHKVSDEISVITTNLTYNGTSIFDTKGNLKAGIINNIFNIEADWTDPANNTAVIDLDGEAGDRCAYVSKVKIENITTDNPIIGYTAGSQVQYQVNDKDTISFSLTGEGTIFNKGLQLGNFGTNIKKDSLNYTHKISDDISVTTTNLTYNGTSIFNEDGTFAEGVIDNIFSLGADWIDSEKNAAIIDLDGKTGDRNAYITGVTYTPGTETNGKETGYVLSYNEGSQVQCQVNDTDTVMFSLTGTGDISFNNGLQLDNLQNNIKADSISYVHKISDNISIMTTNITIDNILSNGRINSTITADWSKTDKNTAIIEDEVGNKLYLIGVNVTGNGTTNPYEISATAGASVRLSTSGENGYDYVYSAKLGNDMSADISEWTIASVLGNVDVNTGTLSVSYEDKTTGITYSYSQSYGSALNYEEGIKIDIEAVFNAGYDGRGKTTAVLKLNDSGTVSVMTTNGLSFTTDGGFTFQGNPVIGSEANLNVSALFGNPDTNTAIINEGTSTVYITKVSLMSSYNGYKFTTNNNSVVQFSETIGNITYSISAGLKTSLTIDKDTTISGFFNDKVDLENAIGSVSIKYGSQITVTTSNISIGDFKFNGTTKTFNFDAVTYSFNVASKNSVTIGIEPNQIVLNGVSVTESNGNISKISTLKSTVAVIKKEENGILYTFTSQLNGTMDIETSTTVRNIYEIFDETKQTFTASYTGPENKIVATSNIIGASIDCDDDGNIIFNGQVVVYNASTGKYELYTTGSKYENIPNYIEGSEVQLTGETSILGIVKNVDGITKVSFVFTNDDNEQIDVGIEFYTYTNNIPCSEANIALFGTNYVYKYVDSNTNEEFINVNMGVEKTGERVDFRIGTYELDIADEYSKPITVSVTIDGTTLTVDSRNGATTSRYGLNTYNLTDFGSLPFLNSKFNNPSFPTDPFEIPIKTVSTTVMEIKDDTQPTGYREKGFVTNRALTSYAFADVTNRKDGQFQLKREIKIFEGVDEDLFSGVTFKGVNRYSVNKDSISCTFFGYGYNADGEFAGIKFSGTYDVEHIGQEELSSDITYTGRGTYYLDGFDDNMFSHFTITNKDGALLGVFDKNCLLNDNHYLGVDDLASYITQAKLAVFDPNNPNKGVNKLDGLPGNTLTGMSYNTDKMEVTDIVFYAGGAFNVQVTIESEFRDDDGTVYVGTSVIGIANLEQDLDRAYGLEPGTLGATISSEDFNGYNEETKTAFTHRREYGYYKEDGSYSEYAEGAISQIAYYTTIERTSNNTRIIKTAKEGYYIPTYGGGKAYDRVISDINEENGLITHELCLKFLAPGQTEDNLQDSNAANITYSYNVSRYVDPTESGEFEGKVEGADYYRNDFTATEIKINEINVSEDGSTISMKQDGYQSTTYIDSQTGEIRYQHTKTSDSESTMMVVYSKVDENSIDRVFKVKSNGEIEEQVDPGIRGLSYEKIVISETKTITTENDEKKTTTKYSEDRFRYFQSTDGRDEYSDRYYLIQYTSFEGTNNVINLKSNVSFNEYGEVIERSHDTIYIGKNGKIQYVMDWFVSEEMHGFNDIGIFSALFFTHIPGSSIEDGCWRLCYLEGEPSDSTGIGMRIDAFNEAFYAAGVSAAYYYDNGGIIIDRYADAGDGYYYELSTYNSDGSVTYRSLGLPDVYSYSWTRNSLNYIVSTYGEYRSRLAIDMAFNINAHAYYSPTNDGYSFAVFENFDYRSEKWVGYNVTESGIRIKLTEAYYSGARGKNGAVYTSIQRNDAGKIINQTEVFYEGKSSNIRMLQVTDIAGNVKKYKLGSDNKIREFTQAEYNEGKVKAIVGTALAIVAVAVLSYFTFGAAAIAAGTATAAGVITTLAAASVMAASIAIPAAVRAVDAWQQGQYGAMWFNVGIVAISLASVLFAPLNAGSSTFTTGLKSLPTRLLGQGVANMTTRQIIVKTAWYLTKRVLIGAAAGLAVNAAKQGVFMLAGWSKEWNWEEFGAWGLAGALTGLSFGLSGGLGGQDAGKLLKIFKVGKTALDFYINTNISGELVEAIKVGDVGKIVSSSAVLISFNIINPIMSLGKPNPSGGLGLKDRLKGTIGFTKNGDIVEMVWANFGRSFAFGAGGFVAGGLIGGLLDNDKDSIWSWKFAAVGGFMGFGFGNALNMGAYNSGVWTQLRTGLNPIGLYTKSAEMIHRINAFNLTFTYLTVGIAETYYYGSKLFTKTGVNIFGNYHNLCYDDSGKMFYTDAEGKIVEDLGFMEWFDSATELFFFNNAKQILIDKGILPNGISIGEGEGYDYSSYEEYRQDFISRTGYGLASYSATDNYIQMVTNPSMWLFSLGTSFFQPLLGPALVNMPGIGTVMQLFNLAGDKIDSEAVNTFMEEGIKEQLIGFTLGFIGIDGQAGEIIQELFDSTPDINMNMLGTDSFFSMLGMDNKKITSFINDIRSARTNQKGVDVKSIANQYGVSEHFVASLITGTNSTNIRSQIGNRFVTEIAINRLLQDGVITQGQASGFITQLNEMGLDMVTLSFAAQVDLLYGLADLYNSNKTNVDFNNVTKAQLENMSLNGLLNYAAAISQSKGEQVLSGLQAAEIIQSRIQSVMDARTTATKENKPMIFVMSLIENKFINIDISNTDMENIGTIFENANSIETALNLVNNEQKVKELHITNVESLTNILQNLQSYDSYQALYKLTTIASSIVANSNIRLNVSLNPVRTASEISSYMNTYNKLVIQQQSLLGQGQQLITDIVDLLTEEQYTQIRQGLSSDIDNIQQNVRTKIEELQSKNGNLTAAEKAEFERLKILNDMIDSRRQGIQTNSAQELLNLRNKIKKFIVKQKNYKNKKKK
ncbi:MAG: hypothetical protein IKN42_00030 [Elusimicrobia bacterium]|nr:hypothetical protein [Elusimicrobiota bacterium]